jgi:hypothetical protein
MGGTKSTGARPSVRLRQKSKLPTTPRLRRSTWTKRGAARRAARSRFQLHRTELGAAAVDKNSRGGTIAPK